MPEIIFDHSFAGCRFDLAVCQAAGTTRARAQKFIKNKTISLNGRPAKPHTAVKAGDVLFYPDELASPAAVPIEPSPELDIIFENDDMIILNKPSGLIVHPVSANSGTAALTAALVKHDPAIARVGDDPARPGLVHRLDKDVSGVMVAAKTKTAFDHLKKQFQNREVEKEYLALLYGALPKDQGQINLKISRSKSQGKMVARAALQAGQEASTKYEVIERFKNLTLVRAWPKTGRTHQLRVHFRAIDHPIVGDRLYAKKQMKNIKPLELGRIFLHAAKLTLSLLDGSRQTFEVPLPNELKSVLKTLPKK